MAALWSVFSGEAATKLVPPDFSLVVKAAAVAACWYLRLATAAAAAAAAVEGSMTPGGRPPTPSPSNGMGLSPIELIAVRPATGKPTPGCGVVPARDTIVAVGGAGVCGCVAPGGVPPPPSVCGPGAGAVVEWLDTEAGGACCVWVETPAPAAAFIAFTAFCDSKVRVLCISMLKKEKTEKQGSKDENLYTRRTEGGGLWKRLFDSRLHTCVHVITTVTTSRDISL